MELHGDMKGQVTDLEQELNSVKQKLSLKEEENAELRKRLSFLDSELDRSKLVSRLLSSNSCCCAVIARADRFVDPPDAFGVGAVAASCWTELARRKTGCAKSWTWVAKRSRSW